MKVMEMLNINHQTVFSHIILVNRRNLEANREFRKVKGR